MWSYRMGSLLKATIIFSSTFLLHLSNCQNKDVSSSKLQMSNKSEVCNQLCAITKSTSTLWENLRRCITTTAIGVLHIKTKATLKVTGGANVCSTITSADMYVFGSTSDFIWDTFDTDCEMKCTMQKFSGEDCKNDLATELFDECVKDNTQDWILNDKFKTDKLFVFKRRPNSGVDSDDSTTLDQPSHSTGSNSDESSHQLNVLVLALGVGLGLALLIAVIIIIVLCVCLARERRKKRGEKPYSKLAPSTATADSRAASSTESHVYTNIDPAVANAHKSSNTPITTPSQAKAPPTGYEEASTVRRPVSSSSIWPRATSVIYAVTDKLKPHRGNNKRTLASPSDDVIIVDNDLYTDETVSGAANGPAGGRTGASNGPDAVYYNNTARTVDGELYAEVSK